MRVSVVLLCLAVVALLAGCLGAATPPSGSRSGVAAHADDGSLSVGATVQNVTWSTTHVGDVALGIGLGSDQDTKCFLTWGAQGSSAHWGPVVLEAAFDSSGSRWWTVGRGQSSTPYASAYASGAVDHQVPEGPLPWASGRKLPVVVGPEAQAEYLLAATDLRLDGGSRHVASFFPPDLVEKTMFFHLVCADPVQITGLAMSDTAVLFDEARFRGGAGAHADGPFGTSGATTSSHVSADVAPERGVLLLGMGGDILLNHVAVGVVEVSTPNGDSSHVDHPTQMFTCAIGLPVGCPAVSLVEEAGPGRYAVSATYASVLHLGVLRGAIVGLDPVDALWG